MLFQSQFTIFMFLHLFVGFVGNKVSFLLGLLIIVFIPALKMNIRVHLLITRVSIRIQFT